MVMSNDDSVDPFYCCLHLRVAASKAFLAPYPAAPKAAPKAIALPLAIRAGNKVASGKMPPFWRLFLLRHCIWFGMMLGMKGHTGGVSHLCSCRVMGHW